MEKADLISVLSKNSYTSVEAMECFRTKIDSISNDVFILQSDLNVYPFNNLSFRKAELCNRQEWSCCTGRVLLSTYKEKASKGIFE